MGLHRKNLVLLIISHITKFKVDFYNVFESKEAYSLVHFRAISKNCCLLYWYSFAISAIRGSNGFGSESNSRTDVKTVAIFKLGFQLPFGFILRISRQIRPAVINEQDKIYLFYKGPIFHTLQFIKTN